MQKPKGDYTFHEPKKETTKDCEQHHFKKHWGEEEKHKESEKQDFTGGESKKASKGKGTETDIRKESCTGGPSSRKKTGKLNERKRKF